MNVLARVQALSGLAFAVFLVLHLATTLSAAGGAASYDGTLASLRAIYRAHPIVEFLLIGVSAAVHIACGVLQILRRRKTRPNPKPEPLLRIHRWAGYVLMAAIVGHVYATRVMPTFIGSSADFSYLAFSVLAWPLFIKPYYYLLGVAGAVHMGLGLGYAAAALRTGLWRKTSIGIAVMAGILVAAGVTGIIAHAAKAERSKFQAYEGLYDRYMPGMPEPASGTR